MLIHGFSETTIPLIDLLAGVVSVAFTFTAH